jgi:DoxX-like family
VFFAYVVGTVLLAAGLIVAAVRMLNRSPGFVETLDEAGVPLSWCTPLAAVELVGAAGLLVGLAIEPVGVAASAGVLLYFLGAMAAHVRAKDWFGLRVPGTVAVLAGVVLWLRIITL